MYTCRDHGELSNSHLKYHLQRRQKSVLGVVDWNFKGEEANLHYNEKANVW